MSPGRAGAEATLATQDIEVGTHPGPIPGTPRTALWFTRAQWTPSYENLYSAWIEHLFDAPLDAVPSWNALHEVLRDARPQLPLRPLGAAEDEQNVVIRPDCADLPYFLRAYFAFKLGLPFGWSHCSRGENGVPPFCSEFATSSDPFPKPDPKDPHADTGRPSCCPRGPTRIARTRARGRSTCGAWASSSTRRWPTRCSPAPGARRTDDETGDYYPVSLSTETLRPGTIFADPYGHVLVVAHRVPQTATSGGILLAVDGQPDGTVARKRFWRGNFLFAIDPALGSAGFKRFRPILRDKISGKWRHLSNSELARLLDRAVPGGVEGFYDKMDDVLSPAPLDPTRRCSRSSMRSRSR